jgi:hypothetical protein
MNTTADIGLLVYDDSEADDREALAALLAAIDAEELGIEVPA